MRVKRPATLRGTCGVLGLAAAAWLAACGDSDASARAASGRAEAAPSGNATAQQVAREQRGRVRCPARIQSPARPAGAPVDDILGVRPGLTLDEAANGILCSHDLLVVQIDSLNRRFNIQAYGFVLRQGLSAKFAEPRTERTSEEVMRQMMDEQAARSRNAAYQDPEEGAISWNASLLGLPGEERVMSVSREEWFPVNKHPTVASVREALLAKYGTPTETISDDYGSYLRWAYDPAGRLITETSRLVRACMGPTSTSASFSPDCGIVVSAQLHPMRDNPGLVRFMTLGIVDQAIGFERITSTEQALRRLESDRRAAELRDADKRATTPRL